MSRLCRVICELDHTPPYVSWTRVRRFLGGWRIVMGKRMLRDYQRNSREFDGWLKANAVIGSVLAIGLLAVAVAGLNAGRPDAGIELSSRATSK